MKILHPLWRRQRCPGQTPSRYDLGHCRCTGNDPRGSPRVRDSQTDEKGNCSTVTEIIWVTRQCLVTCLVTSRSQFWVDLRTTSRLVVASMPVDVGYLRCHGIYLVLARISRSCWSTIYTITTEGKSITGLFKFWEKLVLQHWYDLDRQRDIA